MRVIIDGFNLNLEKTMAVVEAGGEGRVKVELSPAAVDRVKEVRSFIDNNWMTEDAPPIYGFNTGVGPLKNEHISPGENLTFQKNLIESHAACIGDPAPETVVRATMLMRANALARGVSGIRLPVIERLVEMLNLGLHPVIPEQGSVGASGDLGPLAHLVMALVGHDQGEAFYQGRRLKAQQAYREAGLKPVTFQLKAKDVLAMINGCSFSLGYAVLALHRAWRLLKNANLACTMSMEAMRGELAAFDDRIHEARNQPGQIRMAREIRNLLEDSQWTTEEARRVKFPYQGRESAEKPRIQDAYTLRCVPQVHGAVYDLLKQVERTLEAEMNAATDNPLIFKDEIGEGYQALSGGNFHGQYLSFATDQLAMAVHELGSISERRSARLLDPNLSYGLPRNLVGGRVGINSGFPVCQCSASALVMENRTLCTPASIDSIPTKSGQEDHVSMATWSARKALTVVDNTFKILGIELLCSAQAISLAREYLEGLKPGSVTTRAYSFIRKRVPATEEDRFLNQQMEEVIEMTRDNSLYLAAVEE